ncbi:MAG: hypothetical protein WCB03_12985 [Rouxiella badensis]|jgi:hypothetical protein|uniref:hypothetical protein n=1 Tax=Rouxiella badensis TaxID=1646377 RepID=UPI0013EEFE07|nr:hypothetical protein [Rouxiella badensis]QII38013.1 hypothetical protein G3M83_10040 [Rouxiella badensis]
MTRCKILTTILLLAGTAFYAQAAEVPLSAPAQPCVEHNAFNQSTDHQDMANPSGHTTHLSSAHCLTSIQSSNNNKLFGNNELFK